MPAPRPLARGAVASSARLRRSSRRIHPLASDPLGTGAPPSFTHASHGSGFSLSGHAGTLRWTKNVAVRLTRSLCPGCGQKVGKKMSACPHCGRLLKKGSEPASGKFIAALRKMLIAATVFIGLPAGVIVFVLVVCAPKGGEVGTNTPRPVAADRVAPRPTYRVLSH